VGFTRGGLYSAKLGTDGRWTAGQLVSEGWPSLPDFWTLTDLVTTARGDIAGVIQDGMGQFAFVGTPGATFSQRGLGSNSSPIYCLRDGFVAGELSAPGAIPQWGRFDLDGNRVTSYGALGLASTGDRAFPADGSNFFTSRYASITSTVAVSKISGTGASIWTVNLLALQSMILTSDGADGLLVIGEFSGDLTVAGTKVSSPGKAVFVAALEGSYGKARWVQTYEGSRHPYAAMVGPRLYLGASIQDASIGTRVGNNLTVRGTGFVARLDLTTGQPVWANPTAYEVKNVAATSAAVWVQSPGTLYRFRP
jgi:hypothetical protein